MIKVISKEKEGLYKNDERIVESFKENISISV